MISTLVLKHVEYMPKQLEPGILYVSTEFEVAGHLCACGCGNKVMTPLGPAEWSFTESAGRPTLFPSIGNWQLPCRSHYLITDGHIRLAPKWSDAQILAGRNAEVARREAYYASLNRERGFWARLWRALRKFFAG